MGERTFLTTKGPLRDADGKVIGLFGISRDITERKQSEQLLRQSLKDKHALLLEVHHRVKNNLQLIVSLLRMEARRSAVEDTQAVFGSMQGRIRSMARLHESLYSSGIFASVNLSAYLGQLGIQAICAGLLVNELVSNAPKHGFPKGHGGEVTVDLQPTEPNLPASNGRWRLCVRDNGVGLPPDFESRQKNSLGLQLVDGLSQQLGSRLEVRSQPDDGSEFVVTSTALEPVPLAMPA